MENRSITSVNKRLKNIKIMNEIDLTKILKDCPKGTKLYSTIYGEVEFHHIDKSDSFPIVLRADANMYPVVTKHGQHTIAYEDKGECVLFPSKGQRDWSKFTAPWYKKERFDPKTLKPFDKVLVRDEYKECWCCDFFSHTRRDPQAVYKCATTKSYFRCCIPYNDETKHLVGTKDEAPMYYRYWED